MFVGHKTLDETKFVHGERTSKDLQVRDNTINLSIRHLGENRPLDGKTSLSENSSLLSDFLSSGDVVTSNHTDDDTSVLATKDSIRDLLTDRITNTDNSQHGQILLRGVDLHLGVVVRHMPASETKSTETPLSEAFDVLQKLTLHVLCQGNLLPITTHHANAAFQHNLRGTFAVQTVSRSRGNHTAHLFPGGREGIHLGDLSVLSDLLIVVPTKVGEHQQSALGLVSNEARRKSFGFSHLHTGGRRGVDSNTLVNHVEDFVINV
mmetsp:Transcript_27125/g.42203  ORF Transcript_27125/g.42203 Transcript_27125/m.42203 type:complete len:264 (-) Transcript_27125:1317-2108(-)